MKKFMKKQLGKMNLKKLHFLKDKAVVVNNGNKKIPLEKAGFFMLFIKFLKLVTNTQCDIKIQIIIIVVVISVTKTNFRSKV